MALTKNIELSGKVFIETSAGLVMTGEQKKNVLAYIKIISIAGDKTEITASVLFSDKEATFQKQYKIPMSVETGALNFIAQAYVYLKTLPEFAGATDC